MMLSNYTKYEPHQISNITELGRNGPNTPRFIQDGRNKLDFDRDG